VRWNKTVRPNVGDTRNKRAFLWLPKSINGVTKWLEFASWEDRYYTYEECYDIDRYYTYEGCYDIANALCGEWRPVRWLEP